MMMTADHGRPRRRLAAVHLVAAALLLIAGPAAAGPAGDHVPDDRPAETGAPTGAATAASPVPVPVPTEQAMRYYRSGNVLWVVNAAWGLLIPALFLLTGFSARIRSWARALGRKWFFVICIYVIAYLLLNFIIDLPLQYYQGFVRQHAYGLSNQVFGKWLSDAVKALLVGLIGGVLFLWVPYLVLKLSPRRWWLYTGLLAIPFVFFTMLIGPVWISPLFNDFGPMRDQALETKILALADRAGIEGGRVFEVNKSVDTERVNAYVTGFLGTKRIVLWDTIIAKLDQDELLFVMAHEMGHYVLGHVVKGVLFYSALFMGTLFLVHLSADALIRRFQGRFGFTALSDIASLPLLILLINVFSLVLAPVVNGFSRWMEHEADRFSLEITRDNHGGAMAFVKLQQENLGNPRPGLLYKLWRSSHPTLADRIEFCNTYRPWASGDPLKYSGHFRNASGD